MNDEHDGRKLIRSSDCVPALFAGFFIDAVELDETVRIVKNTDGRTKR